MINLAGKKDCDDVIKQELYCADIPGMLVTPDPVHYEVPFSYVGQMGPFRFERLWYYWAVTGPVPLAAAQEMYQHQYGRKDVRVAGHCGCPPPEAPWLNHNGCVDSYHIDSQAGLCLFARTARKYGLLGETT